LAKYVAAKRSKLYFTHKASDSKTDGGVVARFGRQSRPPAIDYDERLSRIGEQWSDYNALWRASSDSAIS
jgi:hypothetical protein